MFTVCPKCALTLAVTAADLRIAQGYVRCGRCLNVFNALARLSEERPAEGAPAAASEPPPDATAAVMPPPGQAPAPAQPPAPSSTIDDTGEIEIELDASVLVTAVPAPATTATPAQPETQSLEATAAEPIPFEPAEPPVPAEKTEFSPPPAEVPDTQQTNTPEQPAESTFDLETPPARAGLAWQLGAGVLAIALVLQIVDHYRDALAANSALRGPLTTVYSALGVKLAPRWDLHAYDVRQFGASVTGTAAGEIVVRASVKNSASRAQPLPLLRVTLQDRFGNRIAARDVPPVDYLPSSLPLNSLLAAGSRVDATMVFVDPGPQAVGFEIDACLREHSGAVACAHGP